MQRCSRIWVLSKRLELHRDGYVGKTAGPQMDIAWFIWDPGHSGPTELHILAPECGTQRLLP